MPSGRYLSGDRKDADKSCHPCGNQSSEGSSGLDHQAGDHDPAGWRSKELKYVKKFVVETADAEIAAAGIDLKYEVGTMIEIPRAALTADEIAKEADFFCFGTNDLTQMTFGFSRDDAGKFLNAYYDAKIYENDPFAKLDQTGVGKLMKMAIELGKSSNRHAPWYLRRARWRSVLC